jgi:uncharacterized protein (UPF0303 family)
MSVEDDLVVIAEQEALLRWDAFDADVAWRLGNVLHEMLVARGMGATATIERDEQVLFVGTTLGAEPSQANWIRRKRNTVRKFEQSSYAVGRMLERDGETLEGRHGLSLVDHAAHGGGFPVWVRGTGFVGTVIVSGLPQREDHNVAVAAIAKVLGVDVPVLE